MHTTAGVILKKNSAGEADALFSIYTRDFGKIYAIAQGVRKETAKLKGHLELLNLVNINFVLGRNGERLTGASLQNYLPGIKSNFGKLSAAWYMVELVDKNCFLGQRDLFMWDLIVSALKDLEAQSDVSPQNLQKFLLRFEEDFLRCLGYGGEKDIRSLGNMVARPV